MRLEGKKPGRVYSLYSKLPAATEGGPLHEQVGTLRPNDADGNENVKKNKRFNKQNNNFARVSRSFVHFFPVFARLRRDNA